MEFENKLLGEENKANKVQTILKTLRPGELKHLKKQHELANGSKSMNDLILEYDKNKKQSKISTKPKTKDDKWERERWKCRN